jgi:nitrite reductase/ring-hydroxylating ferredoxin subunit
MRKSALKGLLLLFCLATVLFACKKKTDTQQPEIPYVTVNFSINPNSTQYLELNHIGGSVPVTGGYRGIIIYRVSETEFKAYERACAYDPTADSAQVRMDVSGLTMTCPKCKSKYIILDGSPYGGPTQWSLKQYRTNYDGTYLYVSN